VFGVDYFSKITQIIAFLNVHQFDFFFVTLFLMTDLIRCPSIKLRKGWGWVCIYFKNHWPLFERPKLYFLTDALFGNAIANRFLYVLDIPFS